MNDLWLFVVVGGPILLAVAIIYAIMRQRRLTPRERDAQKQGVEEVYRADR